MGGETVIIFDFDRTLIEDDSDRWVVENMGLTQLFNHLRSTLPWNFLMDRMLEELHNQGKTVNDIAECLKQMPLHTDVVAVIKSAHALGCDLKVVSDSNHFYIKTILEHHGIYECFSDIVTNPVVLDGGCLRIFPYHDGVSSHGCDLCPPNLCKGHVIKQIQASVTENKKKRLIYIGDGMNDFCPTLKLVGGDCVLPRKDFPLWSRITKNPEIIKANVYEWSNGEDLAEILLRLINCQPLESKILIGSSDWEDHSRGKEGAEKYRTQNLPNWTCCPGVYELGVAALRPGSRRGARKFELSIVVPVYVGQADNLRTRLQQYGRDGAHLENRCLNHKSNDHQTSSPHKGLGLFTDIFSRGFPILYRCAPMESKKDAETTERQLLDKFDYAWNKGSNGPRRPYDIHRKLDHLLEQSQVSLLAKKLIFVYKKPVGIKIKTCEPCLSKKGPDLSSADNITIFSRIFRSKRLQPGPRVQHGDHGSTDICGVAIGQGSVCRIPPVEGRKRCSLHKGMKVNGSVLKLNNERKVVHPPVGGSVGSATIPEENAFDFQHHPFGPICGFIMENGAPCREEPFLRNKRCLEHKGRRIRKS